MSEKNTNKKKRIITAVIGIPIIAVLLYLRGAVLGAFIVIAVLITIHEEFMALRAGGYKPVSFPTWIACIGYLPLNMLFPNKSVLMPFLCSMFFIQTLVIMSREKPNLLDNLVSCLPLFSLAVPGMCLINLLNTPSIALQILLISGCAVTAIVCDIFAYEFGTRIGKTPFFQNISPHKTVEGAVGGLIGAMLSMFLLGVIIDLGFQTRILHPLLYLLIGAGAGVASQLGDLFASMIKRHCGIKDFGNLFPGHGGMLDRMDSILFVAVYMLCVKLLLFQ